MSFSGVLRLVDLDDFITPSQACIKPVQSAADNQQQPTSAVVSVSGAEGRYTEALLNGEERVLKPAKVTLNDCLACSGCVTSAESVLIEQQGCDAFRDAVERKRTGQIERIVVTVSPQSVASLAVKYGLSIDRIRRKLSQCLRTHHLADCVLDSTLGRNIALKALEQEVRVHRKGGNHHHPLIASACPGWICYAEKSAHALLPALSRVRSPQAILGAFVKSYLARKWQVSPGSIFHLSVMPCFDKKLEASRSEFVADDENETREVDCVISTAEVLELLMEYDEDVVDEMHSVDEIQLDSKHCIKPLNIGVSGGFADYLFRRFSDDCSSQWTVVRNRDFQECVEVRADGGRGFSVAIVYGFRNIQTMAMRMKSAKKTFNYDFVEVMACPSGCTNGGGQIRDLGVDQSSLLEEVNAAYSSDRTVLCCSLTDRLLAEWLGTDLTTEYAKRCLLTDYRAVEKTPNLLNLKW